MENVEISTEMRNGFELLGGVGPFPCCYDRRRCARDSTLLRGLLVRSAAAVQPEPWQQPGNLMATVRRAGSIGQKATAAATPLQLWISKGKRQRNGKRSWRPLLLFLLAKRQLRIGKTTEALSLHQLQNNTKQQPVRRGVFLSTQLLESLKLICREQTRVTSYSAKS